MTKRQLAILLAHACSRMEGWDGADPRAGDNTLVRQNRNPIALTSWGSQPIVKGLVKFKKPQDGWEAAYHQWEKIIERPVTLFEAFEGKPGIYDGFASSKVGNDSESYAKFVSSLTGIPFDGVQLGTFVNQPIPTELKIALEDSLKTGE